MVAYLYFRDLKDINYLAYPDACDVTSRHKILPCVLHVFKKMVLTFMELYRLRLSKTCQ